MFRFEDFTHNWITATININEIENMQDKEFTYDRKTEVVHLDHGRLSGLL